MDDVPSLGLRDCPKALEGFFVHPLPNRDGFCDVARVSSDSFAWIVSLVPEDEELRLTIKTHGLFHKELSFYRCIAPLLRKIMDSSRKKSLDLKMDIFTLPNFVDGHYDEESGRGFLVLEDFMEKGFRVDDPSLLLLNPSHIFNAYHAIMPEEDFGEVHISQESTWFQEDMAPVLKGAG
ncbi:Uncharacterized protein FKW44_007693 [Caligus rogercresseyi]|uniref:Uncharacterized protein n=1 Tax=Caligus rogercresseyi TaxID=217165 RepID=A0A7T8QTR4_CALRO|nr:Uncharacterized protein FKW44_007693 [Caligus rogercresseyi]